MASAQTVTAPRPAATATRASREEAMKCLATGLTAAKARAYADDPVKVAAEAADLGVTTGFVRGEALALADAIDAVAAEGLTPGQCWFALGLDEVLGRFPGIVPRQEARGA